MAIQSISVNNVMVFEHQTTLNGDAGEFHLDFCGGINVLIGENGVGKTTLLKMIYAATQWSREENGKLRPVLFSHYFSSSLQEGSSIRNTRHPQDSSSFRVTSGQSELVYRPAAAGPGDMMEVGSKWSNISAVFIPTTEMLSHAKGFLALNEKYRMPFDRTQVDIIVNASLPETIEVTPVMQKAMEKISGVIEGTVIQIDDIFYVVKKDGRRVDFSLEAEGYRKLGLLWKLIRNGLLEPGSVLLWDEPEANLNPELYPLVAEILLELANSGVQIFAATHSYNFAKYLEIRRTSDESVLFHNLFWAAADSEANEAAIQAEGERKTVGCNSAHYMEKLSPNHIMMADNRLLDEVYDL